MNDCMSREKLEQDFKIMASKRAETLGIRESWALVVYIAFLGFVYDYAQCHARPEGLSTLP